MKERTRNETHHATAAWLALGAAIVAWEIYGEETFTHATRRGLESDNPLVRNAIRLGIVATAAHLLDSSTRKLPVDPFYLSVDRTP